MQSQPSLTEVWNLFKVRTDLNVESRDFANKFIFESALLEVLDLIEKKTLSTEFVAHPAIDHESGPISLTLQPIKSPDNRFIRFHFWNNPNASTLVHSHRWNFRSWVLFGHLIETEWTEKTGNFYTAYDHFATKSGNKVEMVGQFDLLKSRQAVWRSGSSRFTPAKMLHSISVANCAPALTMVVEEKRLSDRHREYIRSDLLDSFSGRKVCDDANITDICHQIRKIFL